MGTVAAAVKELRESLGMTQEELSVRAGFPGGSCVYVAKIETGRNELSTIAARERVAKGFGLNREQLDAYLEGRATLDAAAALRKRGERVTLETLLVEVTVRSSGSTP